MIIGTMPHHFCSICQPGNATAIENVGRRPGFANFGFEFGLRFGSIGAEAAGNADRLYPGKSAALAESTANA